MSNGQLNKASNQQPATKQVEAKVKVERLRIHHRFFNKQLPILTKQAAEPSEPATSNQQPVTSNQQPATSNQQPATSNQQPESLQ